MDFTVVSVDEGFSDALRWHLEPFRRAQPQPLATRVMMYVREEDEGRTPTLYSYVRGTDRVFQNESISALVRFAVWDLHYQATQNVRAYLALHSGAVTSTAGALLLPGPADSGKSTLVTSLVSRGFGYLSDEVGALDPITGRAYPFPKHVSLDPEALGSLPGLEPRLTDREGLRGHPFERYVRAEDLEGGIGGPSPVRWLVFLEPDHGGPPRIEGIAKAEAVERMAGNAFNLYRYEGRGVILLSRVASEAEAFVLRGGTVEERAELLGTRFLGGTASD